MKKVENIFTGGYSDRGKDGRIRSQPATRPTTSKGVRFYADQLKALEDLGVAPSDAVRKAIDHCLEHCPEILAGN